MAKKKSRIARHRSASHAPEHSKGRGRKKNDASHVEKVNAPEVTPPAQAAYSDPVIQGDIVGIFASALSLADIMDRVHSIAVIDETHPLFRSSLPLRMRIENGLKSVGTITAIPKTVLTELATLASIFQELRLKCVTIPDVCFFLAKADLRDPAWRGWQAVVAANPADQNLYPWAAELELLSGGSPEQNALATTDVLGASNRTASCELPGKQPTIDEPITCEFDSESNGTRPRHSESDLPELTETRLLILRCVARLGATDASHKVKAIQIAMETRLASGTRLRSELAILRDLKLLGGVKGTCGYWLTEAGALHVRATELLP